MVHRDLKPANIIVGMHGETLVVDWGLAKSVGRSEIPRRRHERTLVPPSGSGSAETLPGSAMGTPAFMSPEQAAGDLDRLGPAVRRVQPGTTLYHALTGRPPFARRRLGPCEAVLEGEFPPPGELIPSIERLSGGDLPEGDGTRSPEDRYASSRALADESSGGRPVSPCRPVGSRGPRDTATGAATGRL